MEPDNLWMAPVCHQRWTLPWPAVSNWRHTRNMTGRPVCMVYTLFSHQATS